MDFEKQELTNAIDVRKDPGWKYAVDAVKGAYTYLENRLTDDESVEQPYRLRLASVYGMFKYLRAFDPGFVEAEKLTPEFVDSMISLQWLTPEIVAQLQVERVDYVAAVTNYGSSFLDRSDLNDFTEKVLTFWRRSSNKFVRTWKKEARRAFCLTPNSASSERVFEALLRMFDTTQECALSDYLEVAVMLEYNKRALG